MASPSNRISRQTPLNVPPLTSMPSVDPPFTDPLDAIDFDTDEQYDCGETKEIVDPSLVFLQSALPMKEIDNILSATSSGVVLGGSAARGMVGPILGKMDIGEDEDSYLFRVALPGVARGSNDFSCDVAPDGQIMIRGHTTTGEKVIYRQGLRFEMVTQNLPPAGHFSISFKLPGPVDTRQLEAVFGIDGILEGIVKKKNPQSNRAGAMEKQETES